MVPIHRLLMQARTSASMMLCVVILAACRAAPSSTGAVPVFRFTAHDNTFAGPTEIPAGLVSLSLENAGHVQHHLQLVELKPGVTIEQLTTAYQQGQHIAAALVDGTAGGPASIAPGATQQVTLELAAGQYALVCLVPDQQGAPHVLSGMVAPLTVSGTVPANRSALAAEQTVTMHEYSYALPEQIQAGPQTWKIHNRGQQPHELGLIKLQADTTFEDVVTYYAAPDGKPPYRPAGGIQSIDHDETGWLRLDLEPGVYVAYCYAPDPSSGKPHFQLGMAQPFTVLP